MPTYLMLSTLTDQGLRTLQSNPERLREVNRVVEEKAWSAYRTEFYATYDYAPIAEQERKKAAK